MNYRYQNDNSGENSNFKYKEKSEEDPNIYQRINDLVIEENTIYEIDYACIECLKKQGK